jgi:hypothetical protein
MRYTGERYAQALAELRVYGHDYGMLPAAATPSQEHLESLVLQHLAGGIGDQEPAAIWRVGLTGEEFLDVMAALHDEDPARVVWPTGTVFGVVSVTPRPAEVLLRVDPAALVEVVDRLLPSVFPYQGRELVLGVPGLRPTRTGQALALVWPERHARILLPGVTARQWRNAEQELLASYAEVVDETPLWPQARSGWTAIERNAVASRSWSRHPGLWSGVLRRLGLMRGLDPAVLASTDLDGSTAAGATPDHHVGDVLPGVPPDNADATAWTSVRTSWRGPGGGSVVWFDLTADRRS